MATTWIEIADTAVKIGLGSSITGVFTYIGIRLTKSTEKEKYLLEHKIKLIEDITTDIEPYLKEVELYMSRVSGIAKYRQNNSLEETPLNEKQIKTIKEHELKVVDTWSSFYSSVAKLKLLKAKPCILALDGVAKAESELRGLTSFTKEPIPYSVTDELHGKFFESRKAFYEEVAELYERIST